MHSLSFICGSLLSSCGLCLFELSILPSPLAVIEFEGHLREGEHEENTDTVHDVEEDNLGRKELGARELRYTAVDASLAISSVVCEDVGHDTEKRVDGSELVNEHERNTSHWRKSPRWRTTIVDI